ncbi:MAG: cell surface protein, partial [Deltaproteobacteria bacterium]|nr:cell surface protein [Kofleriaceae bacterium]
EEAGCSDCHEGALLTDRSLHTLPGTTAPIDTPSLVGLAASAPYYHDGSAETLDELLRSYGTGREMADLESLTLDQRADLKAFLETR